MNLKPWMWTIIIIILLIITLRIIAAPKKDPITGKIHCKDKDGNDNPVSLGHWFWYGCGKNWYRSMPTRQAPSTQPIVVPIVPVVPVTPPIPQPSCNTLSEQINSIKYQLNQAQNQIPKNQGLIQKLQIKLQSLQVQYNKMGCIGTPPQGGAMSM